MHEIHAAPRRRPGFHGDRLGLRSPEAVALLEKTGVDPEPGTPEQLGAYMKREYETWGKVVKQAGIKAQ